jgi:hypothetical protein
VARLEKLIAQNRKLVPVGVIGSSGIDCPSETGEAGASDGCANSAA